MSALKGYPSKKRDLRLGAEDLYITGEPVRANQQGLSVLAHQFVVEVATDAAEAGSAIGSIVATSHVAQVGDVIKFTSGALSGKEVKVQSVSTNLITLSEDMVSAPAAADAFAILRHKYPEIDASGALFTAPVGSGPLQYKRDGATTDVSEDTITPSNSRPLPVKLTGVTGDINITAGDLNVSLSQANDSVAVYGNDGGSNKILLTDASGQLQVEVTNTVDVNAAQSGTWNITNISGTISLPTGASTEAKQDSAITELQDIEADVEASNVLLGTIDADTSNISTKIDTLAGAVAGSEVQVDIVSAPTLTVQATDLDIRDLTSASDSVAAVQSGTWNINNVSGTVSLPTGAATETTLSAINGKITAVNTGAVVISSSALPTGAATETTLSSLNSKVTAVNTGAVVISSSALPSGAATEATLATLSTNTATLDFLSRVRNVYSSVNVTTGAWVQLIASTTGITKRLEIFDSSGQTLELGVGAPASEVAKTYIIPGGNGMTNLVIPAGSSLSVRAVSGTANTGELTINLIG